MKRFDKIKEILDTLVNGKTIGGHGAFWRGLGIDEFKAKSVFGFPLLIPGDSINSNLIRALSGKPPFGADIGTTQAFFRRMPAGLPAASSLQIQYIANWIDAGCPDDDDPTIIKFALPGHQVPAHHNSYWRDFDDWAMFNASSVVGDSIGKFFPIAPLWFAYAKNSSQEAAWAKSLLNVDVRNALSFLSQKQQQTVTRYYGDPIDLDDLFDSYKHFGSGNLPSDPLRPQDPDHKMNGREMWFIWSAFSDGCIRLGIDTGFWTIEMRAILVGLLHDGLFRQRFNVSGFSADAAGSEMILQYARSLAEDSLQKEMCTRLVQSGV